MYSWSRLAMCRICAEGIGESFGGLLKAWADAETGLVLDFDAGSRKWYKILLRCLQSSNFFVSVHKLHPEKIL